MNAGFTWKAKPMQVQRGETICLILRDDPSLSPISIQTFAARKEQLSYIEKPANGNYIIYNGCGI